ncbi:NIN-like protein [Artemisia annua]|uniref:NIN-like protein n=1 Tax=Artemisia annua TaxID=35608 RepID=A0A2U1NXV1_ARTAN|nr:NIN-like protein [Artemisia annua]
MHCVTYRFNVVIQFWAPSEEGLLLTCDQPFVSSTVTHPDPGVNLFEKYRLYSQNYRYNIDVNKFEVENVDPMIINGPPATAFLNHLQEIEPIDCTTVHKLSPLLRYAFEECKFTSYFMLPVFDTSQSSSSSCAGVVECCTDMDGLGSVLLMVKHALNVYFFIYLFHNVGLSTFRVQECPAYMAIPGLKRATYEINEALDIVCESHDLAIAQVWIPYDIENHVPSPSSLEGNLTRQKIAFKLTGSCVDLHDDNLYGFKKYYDTCYLLPLNFGDGLVGKALQTYEPHFCRDLYDLPMTRDKKLVLLLSSSYKSLFTGCNNPLPPKKNSSIKCSCLAICLRSIDTGDIDYAFEFLWPRSRNYFILLESLLLTLKSCLPSFKFASGEQLGDELRVVDVKNSTGSGIGFFKIFEGNRISQIHKALADRKLVAEDHISSSHVKSNTTPVPKHRECTRKQIGRSVNEDAENYADYFSACNLLDASGLTQPTVVKRNLSEYESQSDSNDDSPNQDDDSPNKDILIINLEYADDVFNLNLPIPLATLAVVKKEINKRCKLNPETYKLKYLDEDGDWILMTSDELIKHCIECQRTVNGSHMRLRVLPLTR